MKNTTLVTLGIILLLFVAAVVAYTADEDKNSNGSTYSTSALMALENNFDFGTINMKDGKVRHIFTLENSGEEPVRITKTYTSCMCTTAYITDSAGKKHGEFGMHSGLPLRRIEIAPGGSAQVEAVFDPAAHGPAGIGRIGRSIYLETNSQKTPRVELKFKAMVVR